MFTPTSKRKVVCGRQCELHRKARRARERRRAQKNEQVRPVPTIFKKLTTSETTMIEEFLAKQN